MTSRFNLPAAAGAAFLAATLAGPVAAETRCGWFSNPSPANAWLTDRSGRWIVSVQGGHQADGDWPDFPPSQWVRQSVGSYGYGCACMNVIADASRRRVVAILSARTRPLSACRNDPDLAGLEG